MAKNLITVGDLTERDFWQIIERATQFKSDKHNTYHTLSNKNISLLFFENSTRTKTSFELATNKMAAKAINFDVATSSMTKGESFADTMHTVAAMGMDAIVLRHNNHQDVLDIMGKIKTPIINAGTGIESHPSQAVLDAYTIYENFNHFDLKVGIIGDVAHSRVARSNFDFLTALGAKVSFGGPDHFMREDQREYQKPVNEIIAESDVVMMLRVQHERHDGESDISNYNLEFGLNSERLGQIKETAIIMHPGPFNIGVEITDEVIKDKRCKILDQVENGVYTRMAILDWALSL